MESMIIRTKTKSEFKVIEKFAKNMQVELFKGADMEDYVLGMLMEKSRKSGMLSEEESTKYLQKLKDEANSL